MPDKIKEYLNNRGITDDLIKDYKLGWKHFYNKWWITIPIFDVNNNFLFYKLRKNPFDDNVYKGSVYPKGSSAEIYGWEDVYNKTDYIFICEGELDRLVLKGKGVNAITSTAGANTFKNEWVDKLNFKKIYICFDNDEAGKKGAEKLIKKFQKKDEVYKIDLPDFVGKGGDITDYIVTHKKTLNDLFALRKKIKFIIKKPKNKKVIVKKNKDGEFDIDKIKKISYINILGLPSQKDNQKMWYKCPLHNEKTPSFCVYLDTNRFHCFGCGKSGSIIDLYMEINSVDFYTALKELSTY